MFEPEVRSVIINKFLEEVKNSQNPEIASQYEKFVKLFKEKGWM